MRASPVLSKASKLIPSFNYSTLIFRKSPTVECASEEDIFETFRVEGTEEASVGRLVNHLWSVGIRADDPRLSKSKDLFKQHDNQLNGLNDVRQYRLGKEEFIECIRPSKALISQTIKTALIVPSWESFTGELTKIFNECEKNKDGQLATYIPQLARADPDCWGMSVCTVDGQRFSLGDAKTPFCFQSVSKPFTYGIASSDLGAEFVHKYIGQEPSGRLFNSICLDNAGKPHNPMVNAGAIVCTSLIKPVECMADRYDFIFNKYKKLAGGTFIGFDNATFLSERINADRNFALAFFMKENNCFPPTMTSLQDTLDLYFQLCSLETDCDSAAVMAASLANGGVCPLTNERCIEPGPCRDVLSLMYSCGMYDYSGQFAFTVGLPAKSGVSGGLIIVIPNLMGICLWSPRLDQFWNSVRGVEFSRRLIQTFALHNYDSLLHSDEQKIDPRKEFVLTNGVNQIEGLEKKK